MSLRSSSVTLLRCCCSVKRCQAVTKIASMMFLRGVRSSGGGGVVACRTWVICVKNMLSEWSMLFNGLVLLGLGWLSGG